MPFYVRIRRTGIEDPHVGERLENESTRAVLSRARNRARDSDHHVRPTIRAGPRRINDGTSREQRRVEHRSIRKKKKTYRAYRER